jgi:hypothetical protein
MSGTKMQRMATKNEQTVQDSTLHAGILGHISLERVLYLGLQQLQIAYAKFKSLHHDSRETFNQ